MSQENKRPLPSEGLTKEQQVMVDALATALLRAAQPEQNSQKNADAQAAVKTIDLIALFYYLIGKLVWIAIAAVIGAAVMGYRASGSMPVYTATSKLYIVGSNGATINMVDLQIGSMLTMDYTEVFKTWEVHEMVRAKLNLPYSYSQMQSMMSVTAPENTRVLYIAVRNTDAQLAADIANAYAEAAKEFILQTMDGEEPNIFSVALVPSTGAVTNPRSKIIMGFLLGSVLAAGIFVLQFVLDDRPRTPEHIQQAADIPILAVIPALTKSQMNQTSNSSGKRGHKHGLS